MFSSVIHVLGSISSPKSSPSKLDDANVVTDHHHHDDDDVDCDDDTTAVKTTPTATTATTITTTTTTTKTTSCVNGPKTLLSAATTGRQQKLFGRQIGTFSNGSSLHSQHQRRVRFDDEEEEDDVSEVDVINSNDDDDDGTIEREGRWKTFDGNSFGTVSVTVSSSSASTSSAASCESLRSHNSASDADSDSESESDSSSVGSSSTLSSSSSSACDNLGDLDEDHEDEDGDDEDDDDDETDLESFMMKYDDKMSPFLLFIDSKESTPSKVSFDGSDQYDDEDDDDYSDYEDDTEFTGTLVLSSDDDDSLLSFLNRSFSKDMMDMGLDMESSKFLSLSSSGSFSSSFSSSLSFPGSLSSESSMPSIIKQQIQGLEYTLDELHQIIHQDDVVSTTKSPTDLADEKKETKVDDVGCEDVAAPVIMISTSGSDSSYSSSDSLGIPPPPTSAKMDNETIESKDRLDEHVPVVEYHTESCVGVLHSLKDHNNVIVEQQDRSTETSHNPKKLATPVNSKSVTPLQAKTGTDNLEGAGTTSFKIWTSDENDFSTTIKPLLTVDDILNEIEDDDVFWEGEFDEYQKPPFSPMTTDPSSSRCSIPYFKQFQSQQQCNKDHSMGGKEQLIVKEKYIPADGLYSTTFSSSSLSEEDCLVDFGGITLQVSPRSTPSGHSETGSNNSKVITEQDVDCTFGPNWAEIESEMESLSDIWSSLRRDGPKSTAMESKEASFSDVWSELHPTPVVLKSILRRKETEQGDDTHKTNPETLTNETNTIVTPNPTTSTEVVSMANNTTRNIQWPEHDSDLVSVHLIEASGRRRRLSRPPPQKQLIILN